jgi:hypothetical protein
MCYTWFGAYPNMEIIWKKEKKKENKRKSQQHRQGLMLGLADLMPDCWLEVCLHL